MRLTLTVEGGLAYFPGLSRPLLVDSERLPEAEVQELKRLVVEARLSERSARVQAPPGAADYYQYTLTMQEGRRRRTVSFTDPIEDPALVALVDYLKAKGKRE